VSRPQFFRTAWAVYRHPHATQAKLRAYQDAQLRRLVRHAYDHVPYYRRLFDLNHVHPRDIRGTADLSRIPISSKQELVDYPVTELIDRRVRQDRLITVCTNGSTGEPFTVRRTYIEQAFNVLFRTRAKRAFGLRARDRIMFVGRAPKGNPQEKKLFGHALEAVGVHRTLKVDGLDRPEEVVRRLEEFQPHMIVALPGILSLTAEYLIGHGRTDIRPRMLVVGGEVLTPVVRRRLTHAFGVDPVQTYASHEFPFMGWECPVSHELHTCDDAVILEVLRDGRPAGEGEDGEVVVTNLHAYAMPLIRYRLADVITRGADQCPCGQPFSTIRAVQGRMLDYFSLPGGRRLHPYRIMERLLQGGTDSWIRQYQFIQDRPEHIVLEVVPLQPVTNELRERIQQWVMPLLGEGVRFEVQVVDRIQFGPGGKYRHSRSSLQSGYEDLVLEGTNV
jgi:phenylacetate-CoA ligase